MKNTQYERGVALLFALGVLSLLLVTGLAFLGNSLVSQKIAINNSELNFARQLARSAAERAMAQLAMFSLLQSVYHDEAGAYDASSVYSSLRFAEQPNSTADGIRNDGLAAKMLLGDMAEHASFANYGAQSKAKWLYVYDNGAISDNASVALSGNPKIIGRYAYQVLPPTSKSRLSLFAVTAGAKKIADYTGSAADRKIPHLHRWGVDVDELLIPGLNDNSGAGLFSELWGSETVAVNNDPQYELDNFFNLFSSAASPNHLYVPANPTQVQKDLSQNYKNWLRNIFSEGTGRIAREAYTDNTSWYPRFNLGRFDNGENWYERFIKDGETVDAVKNNSVIIDRLTRHPGKALTINGESSSAFKYVDGYLDDSQYDPFGLPFLRCIGSGTEKGAFDTVANLRKQIAANLNDYCDDDSIPTSDVPATGWGNLVDNSSGTASLPLFTGNEKTPYINEIGFEFKLDGSTLSVEEGKYVFKPGLKGRILAELIGVYKGLQVHSAELCGKLNSLSVTLKVGIKGQAQLQYTEAGKDAPTSRTADFSSDRTALSLSAEFVLTCGADGKFTITDFVKTPNLEYWMGRQDLTTGAAVTLIDFTDEIKKRAEVPEGTDVSFTNTDGVTDVKVEITDVKFNLGNLALKIRDKADAPTVDGFVDFVRVEPGVRHKTGTLIVFSTESGWILRGDLASNTAEGKGFFYVGSMQAIDPRQNLFAKLDDVKENDWFSSFEPTFGAPAEDHVVQWDALNKSGKCNASSNPASPKYADGEVITNKDTETATDPAWNRDESGQHISTAVIRNAPMRSPWELGFIHRGIPFQTINLKRTGGVNGTGVLADDAHKADNCKEWTDMTGEGVTGTLYQHGDAGILDQIKMTSYNKSFGKVDLESLATTPWWALAGTTPTVADMNVAVFKSLFTNIRRQKPLEFLEESIEDNKVLLNNNALALTGTGYTVPADLAVPTAVSSVLRSKILETDAAKWVLATDTTDAAKEELVGKTFNLLEGKTSSPPNVFRILVVAQSIRDLSGPLSRWDLTVTPNRLVPKSTDAEFSVFDVQNGLYYDEIMGECRMLMTVENVQYMDGNTPRARLRVKQIEYLD